MLYNDCKGKWGEKEMILQDVIKFPETLNYHFHFLHCGFENGGDLEKKSSYYERFVISYLVDGRGMVTMDGKSFSIEKGDLYFIEPSVIAQKTTKTNTYKYYYIAISGPDCGEMFARAGYSKEKPVIKLNDEFVEGLMMDICDTSRELTFSSMLKMRISFLQLLEYLYNKNKQNEVFISNKPSILVENIKQYIETNYQNEFLIKDFSKLMHYTQPYLSKVFKAKCGTTIKAYITEFRINKACYLLRASDLSVLEIALEVGFHDVSTFCRAFKRCKGISPKKFRK